jgi:DNA-binding NarL/FixJ family response regulator
MGAVAETTVLIVDDHSGFRVCARRMLEREGYRVVGEAPDGESAVSRARELSPQLALVDVCLPGIDGFEVASRLAELEAAPAVVLISSRDRSELGSFASGGVARGFVRKDELSRAAIEELL